MHRFATDGIAASWKGEFDAFFASEAGKDLLSFLQERLKDGAVIYPPDPYRVFRLTQPQDVRVVILGQDPYHGPGQAMGMAFSVPAQLKKLPPSLKNIFKEIALEGEGEHPAVGDLTDWVRQGVLLMNATLTVEDGAPQSHAGKGWETLTDRLIDRVLEEARPTVFMLWGASAQKKKERIQARAKAEVLVLSSNHPSPLSARRPPVPFIGCGHFKAANDWLQAHGREPIAWVSQAFSWGEPKFALCNVRAKKSALFRCKIGDN